MRAGLCLIVGALGYIRDAGIDLPSRLQLFISADEEEGSATAHPHMERMLSRDGERKGVGQYRVELRGREAHAGVEPDEGASAVHEMARRIIEVQGFVDLSKGVTVNVGKVEGGTAANVVAGRASMTIDLRFDHLSDGEKVHRRILSLASDDPRVSLAVKGGIIFPPLEATERSLPLCARAVEIARDMGLGIGIEKSGGGSDGAFLSALGLGVVDGLGVDGGGAHALHEHIRIDRLALRAAYFTRLILEFGGGSRRLGG
jgi:glutamate carboxypeptidase